MTLQLSLLSYPQRARVAHPPDLPVVVDLFAGGGGASEGIRRALGVEPVVAINHDPGAIEMHAANHPGTLHLCESVHDVRPGDVVHGRPVDLLWASPDCTHFSRAKGGKPRKQEIRSLAWVVVTWAREVRPRVICLENVPEFLTWGPLDADGRPDKARSGEIFAAWVEALRGLGYDVEWQMLVAADYGAPTTRKRLFLVARCDGRPIRWPEPTHGPGRAHPYRTAGECIDWSIPTRSIFGRKRPLAEATQRRIAAGLVRYVLEAERPYLVDGGAHWLINTRNTAKGSQGALVSAWLAKHNGSGDRWAAAIGQGLDEPMHTVTARDTKALVAAHLTKFYGTSTGADLSDPIPTITASSGGEHMGLVAAFLTAYYGSERDGQALDEPLRTIPTRDRFGLVTVTLDGEPYVVTDIGMRMLQPRELATAQGFGLDYELVGTQKAQTARIGNSVCPDVAAALVGANVPTLARPALEAM